MTTKDDVVITGIGLHLPGASSVAEFWKHLQLGSVQAGRVAGFVEAGLPVVSGAQIHDFDHRAHLPDLPDKYADRYNREILITMSAAAQALDDAGLTGASVPAARVGLVASSSRPALREHGRLFDSCGPTPDTILRSLPSTPASLIAINQDIQGPVTTLTSACIGGSQAIGLAASRLRLGEADAMVVGAYEFPLLPELVRAYVKLGAGVLSPDPSPTGAMRPYSRDRSGFVLGEGALFLCLERASAASRRGAQQYGRVLAEGSANDALHPTTMDMTGERAARLVREVIGRSEVPRSQIGYVCGHGSATQYNDVAESRVVNQVFAGLPDPPPLGSIKPVFGHSLGMSSLVNVAAVALMLREQTLAPTPNCVDPDPDCPHDHVVEGARKTTLEHGLSLSYGLGGQFGAVLLGAPTCGQRRDSPEGIS
ncbi:beta-ketoacyl-[acyl-carrier-protein] synthase family protein [Micromonospora sp. NPDC050417]|uniref:beta-ketoacyl-[acyl-carrier-protein] synthase family protein n=1 Tax=Micromonospora sp. NPDC050417 TaxID=3364280 RepID=UPI0037AB5A14